MILLALLMACRCVPMDEQEVQDHYPGARAVRAAVYQGNLGAMREGLDQMRSGGGFADHDGRIEEIEARLGSAVGFMRSSEDTTEAALGLAELALACGECHAETGGPRPSEAPGLDPSDPVSLHRHAHEILWNSLMIPDPESGARVSALLAAEPLALGEGLPTDAAERIRAAAKTPGDTPTKHLRDLYAVMAGACVDCHPSGTMQDRPR